MPDLRHIEARLLAGINRLLRRMPRLTPLERLKLVSLTRNLKIVQARLRPSREVMQEGPGLASADHSPNGRCLCGACGSNHTGGHFHGNT